MLRDTSGVGEDLSLGRQIYGVELLTGEGRLPTSESFARWTSTPLPVVGVHPSIAGLFLSIH